MAAKSKKNRKHGVIDDLPQPLKDAVDQMLLANRRYSEVVDFLATHSVAISTSSICRYAQAVHADMEMLKIAGENFRRMTEELERTPNVDIGEALSRIAGQHLLSALRQVPEEAIAEVPFDKLIKETSALTKVLAYKKNVDAVVRGKVEAALAELQQTFADTMAVEDPEAFKKLDAYLERKRAEIRAQNGG